MNFHPMGRPSLDVTVSPRESSPEAAGGRRGAAAGWPGSAATHGPLSGGAGDRLPRLDGRATDRVQQAGEGTDPDGADRRVLAPGRNVWRIEAARRAAMLPDAANYYGTLRRALLRARHRVVIVGWDIDSRTPLVGPDGETHDDLPPTLGPFLRALVERRPGLEVKLLLWDYSVFYSLEREFLPIQVLQRETPPAIELCLDDVIPLGASHHQKIVVIDDDVAFCGGLDLTIRRWDDSRHDPDNPLRVDPAGKPYDPFHDVQMAVDGDAAAALGELVRERWALATGETLDPVERSDTGDGPAGEDAWPEDLAADFEDVGVGIARTRPRHGGEAEVREIEALHADMIASAERTIYIENQFLTSSMVAEAIAARLGAVPELEVLIVAPKTHHTWIEHMTMLAGRIRFRSLVEAGLDGDPGDADARLRRLRLVHPEVGPAGSATAVMVHAKVMVVDDRLLRIGSANICNRSCGTDTECDLVIEARSDAERRAIAAVRNRLVGEHCGAEPAAIAEAMAANGGSLLAAVDALTADDRRLAPIDDGTLADGDIGHFLGAAADPERPPEIGELLMDVSTNPPHPVRTSRIWKGAAVLAAVALFALAWRYTPLSALADEAFVASVLPDESSPWTPIAVVAGFVVAGLFAFPVTLLIGTTSALFGAWPGIFYAAAGAIASAVTGYLIGRAIGLDSIRSTFGPGVNRISRGFAKRGIVAVTTVRLVPIAPFSLVNVMAGAMKIRLVDFVIGTFLGLAPGLVLMSALGEQMLAMISNPTWSDIAWMAALVMAWIGLSVALQWGVARLRRSDGEE